MVTMSMMEFFMRQKLRGMSTEEKVDMMREMMPIMFEEMDAKEMPKLMKGMMPVMMKSMKAKMDIETVMPKMAPEMFENFMADMPSDKVYAMMSRMIPKMLPLCFAKLSEKDRKKAAAILRAQLDKLENPK